MSGIAITAELVVFGLAVLGAIAGLWWRIEARIDKAASDNALRAEAAKIKAETAARELAEYKVHVAETFATKAGLTESLNRLHDALDKLTARIDMLIQQSSKDGSQGGRGNS